MIWMSTSFSELRCFPRLLRKIAKAAPTLQLEHLALEFLSVQIDSVHSVKRRWNKPVLPLAIKDILCKAKHGHLNH